MKKIIFSIFGFLLLFSFSAFQEQGTSLFTEIVYAECTPEKIADGVPCSDSGFEAPDKNEVNEKINEPDFRTQVLKIVNYFLTFLGLLAVVSIVYAGVIMVADFGDEELVGKAKNILIWSSVGIVIVLLSYSFVNWVILSGDGIDEETNTGNGTQIEGTINEGTKFLDDIEAILNQIGKLDKNTSDLLNLISEIENRPQDFSEEYAKIAEALADRSYDKDSYYDTIANALDAQGYETYVAESITQKIENGEELTEDDFDKLKTSLRYGLMLERFETELNILYKSMPKTAVNEAAYNDVITLFTEVRADPSNDVIIQKLQDAFSQFKQVIQSTPAMIARISVNPATGSAPLIVTFDGTDSSDPNNETIPNDSYSWTFLDHQGIEKRIGTGPIVEYEFTEPGLYVVQLRVETAVKEGGFKTAMDGTAKVKIKVQPQSSDLQVFVNGKIVESVRKIHISEAVQGLSFDASKSTARVGRRIIEYKWNFGDGAVDFSENGDPVVHGYDKAGQFNVRLETKDNTGEVTVKDFKVIVEHLSAEIDISPEEGTTQTVFDLDGLESKSSDFVIQNYEWTIFNEEGKTVKTSDEDTFNFHPEEPGTHTVRLTVKDAEGNQATDTYKLKITSMNPTASFIAHRKSSSQPATYVFNAASSSDPENDVLSYSWDFDGDGNFEVTGIQDATIEHTFIEVGSYKTFLEVKDIFGESDTLTQNITVESILAVDFDMNNAAAQQNTEVIFTPQSANAEAFYWDFGDGTQESSSAENIAHIYTQAGNYTVTLTVFDNNDQENKVSKRIFIGDTGSPVAAFQVEIDGSRIYPETDVCGSDLGIRVNRRNNIKFIGSPSINTDGSHHMLNYTWNFGDGEFGTTKVASHRYSELTEENCFDLTLSVSDRVSGQTNITESIAVEVANMPAQMQKLLINTNTSDTEIFTPLDVRLQAQGAYDPDGTIGAYRWWYRNINDGPEEKRGIVQTQQPFANITITTDGLPGLENEYIFVVEMTDNEGLSITSEEILEQTSTLSVKNGNIDAPLVDFTLDKNQIYIGDTVSFFAQVKNIKDTSSLTYEWDFDGDGVFDDTTSGMQVARRFDSPGEYEVRLRVKHKGLTSSKRHSVFVDNITDYPLAAFTFQTQDLTLIADASTSKANPAFDNNTLRFSWDFDRFTDMDGDGNPTNDDESNELQARYRYDQEGTYFVTLTVTDNIGATGEVQRKVSVRPGESTGAITKTSFSIGKEKQSLRIQSRENPITTLDLALENDTITVATSSTLSARILNADGSKYNGEVEFIIIEGNAEMSRDFVTAKNGVAETEITGISPGTVNIKVIARDTFYETLEESISFEILEKE